MTQIVAIVATGLNLEIGLNNTMPWHLPADLRFFKQTTMGHPVIMGRKTYESIGKALPGRKNIVLSRSANFAPTDALVAQSPAEAIELLQHEAKVFVIGGASIYANWLPLCHELWHTQVQATFTADKYFPEIRPEQWQLSSAECRSADDRNPYDIVFRHYSRKPIN